MTMQRLWPFYDQLGEGFFGGLSAELYDPVWLRCIEQVVDHLKAMAASGRLEEIAEASVVAAEQPDVTQLFGDSAKARNLEYPGIIVWPYQQEAHAPGSGPNDRDEITYPVAVSFVDTGSAATGTDAMIISPEAIRRHMLWRERVSRRFRFASWPTITEVRESNVRYQLYALPEQYRSNNIFHGAIIIDFIAWEGRDDDDGDE